MQNPPTSIELHIAEGRSVKLSALNDFFCTQVFNPAIVEAWGRTLLFYRVHRRPSLLAVSELGGDLQPLNYRLLWPLFDALLVPEDPRVLVRGENLYIMWVGAHSDWQGAASVCHGELDRSYNLLWKSPCWRRGLEKTEKNWIPFLDNAGRLLCIAEHEPFTVYRYGPGGAWHLIFAAEIDWPWKWGTIRGGAPPLRVEDVYYVFFHSSRLERDRLGKIYKIYYVGCYVLSSSLQVLKMTREPIMAGTIAHFTEPWQRGGRISSVFPCGTVLRNNEFLISYGWLDSESRIAAIPRTVIDDLLISRER